MSLELRIEVYGLEEFQENMKDFEQAVQEYVQQALNQCGQLVVNRAKEIAPVRTGLLVSSIFSSMIYRWVVQIVCRVPYAIYQEFGTRYIEPRYFLTRALQENMMNFLTVIAAGLQSAMDEVST